jgi:hypothetical protein
MLRHAFSPLPRFRTRNRSIMSTINYSEKIPNNVQLADDRTLQRALEQ